MRANDYQYSAARTINWSVSTRDRILNFTLGLCGEAGEAAEFIKHEMFHGHAPPRAELYKELGDVLWYIAALCTTLDVELEQVMQMNIDKLRKRYPDKFTEEASRARADVSNPPSALPETAAEESRNERADVGAQAVASEAPGTIDVSAGSAVSGYRVFYGGDEVGENIGAAAPREPVVPGTAGAGS